MIWTILNFTGLKLSKIGAKLGEKTTSLDYGSVSHLAVLRNIFSKNTVRRSEDVEILKKKTGRNVK